MSAPNPSTAEIHQALERLLRWERGAFRRRVIVWTCLAIALAIAANLEYRRQDVYFDILQTQFQDQLLSAPLDPAVLKKEGTEVGGDLITSADVVDLVDVRNVLRALSQTTEWSQFVALQDGNPRFVFAMTILRDLEFVEFEGANFMDAHLTGRGYQWLTSTGRELIDDREFRRELPDDIYLTARVLIPNSPAYPDALSDDDENWYRFTVDDPAVYTIRTLQHENTPPLDTVIRLLDASEEEIGSDDDAGIGTYSLLNQFLGAGNYYLGVGGYYGDRGNYLVSVATERMDVQNLQRQLQQLRNSASEISPDGEFATATVAAQQSAWHRFEVAQSAVYVILTCRTADEPPIDTVIRLYDSAQEGIGFDDDGGDDLYSLFREQLSPGEYYLNVEILGGLEGSYSLSVATEAVDASVQEQRLQAMWAGASELRPNGAVSY